MRYSKTMRPADVMTLWRFHQSHTERLARDAVRRYREQAAALELRTGLPVKAMKVLEIGCGQRFHNVALFSSHGADITGVDLEPVGTDLRAYWSMLRSVGPGRLAKTVVRRALFDRAFWRQIEAEIGTRLRLSDLQLTVGDAATLPFPSASFDAVISTAVWEHLPDVSAAVEELCRVLRPGGICHVAIHLFPSLSGGHHLDWQQPAPARPPRTPPWDHLRENRQPAHVYLNRLRKQDYLDAFGACMTIEDVRVNESGAEWLLPEIEAQLARKGYSRQELLETELDVVARRRATGQSSAAQKGV